MRLLSISLFVWRGSGRISSQTEVLQSPWIPETCSRHLLIFSFAKYNYTQSCLLAGTLVTAFFVRGLFLKISYFSSSDLAQSANGEICTCVCFYFCICVFLVFLCVFLFVFQAYLCIFISFRLHLAV